MPSSSGAVPRGMARGATANCTLALAVLLVASVAVSTAVCVPGARPAAIALASLPAFCHPRAQVSATAGQPAVFRIGGAALQHNRRAGRVRLATGRGDDVGLGLAVFHREGLGGGDAGVVAVAGQHADQRCVGCAALEAAQVVVGQRVRAGGRAGIVGRERVPGRAAVVAVLHGEEQLVLRVRVAGASTG